MIKRNEYVDFFVEVTETIPKKCFPIKDKQTLQMLIAIQSLYLIIRSLKPKKEAKK